LRISTNVRSVEFHELTPDIHGDGKCHPDQIANDDRFCFTQFGSGIRSREHFSVLVNFG